MSWTLAPCLDTLRRQVNEDYPNRDKTSDGTVGDLSHQARVSDHNPDADDVVCAIDLTDDETAPGMDADDLADEVMAEQMALPASARRITYVINDGIIRRTYDRPKTATRPFLKAGVAEKYTGLNAHLKHAHFSCSHTPRLRDNATRFNLKDHDMAYTETDRKRDNDNYARTKNQGVAIGKILTAVQGLATEMGATDTAAAAAKFADEVAKDLTERLAE